MPTANRDTIPYWSTSTDFPQFTRASPRMSTRTSRSSAPASPGHGRHLLAKQGRRVVLLERNRCVEVDTGHTSAHLTMVTDARFSDLVNRFGRNHAQAVWDAGLAALATVDEVVREHGIDAHFAWVGRVPSPAR